MTDWTAAQCAAAWGVKPPTWRAYVARKQAPQPVRHVGRTPIWESAAVLAARPAASSIDTTPPKLELRLPDTTHTLAANLAIAADQTTARDEREEAGRDADITLHATARVLERLRDICRSEGEQAATEAPDVDAERIAWFDLMADLDRLALSTAVRAGVARQVVAEYEDI